MAPQISTRALIVGIDGYPNDPLTSAVNDAERFRQALVDLDLVDPTRITMLTSPGSLAPTRKAILDELFDIYSNGDTIERFVFFFAGHGLSTFADAAHGRVADVIVPVDVRTLDRDGDLLINLDELRQYMRQAGPQEQLYFIDACRDLPADRHPNVGTIPWGGRNPGNTRRQATLYAVSKLGQALAARGGLGVMTSHLIDALHGHGVALDYDDATSQFVVTMASVRNHTRDAVGAVLAPQPGWKQKYMLPELDAPDPQTIALRVVSPVPPAPLTIHVEPAVAFPDTEVTLALRRVRLQGECLPPQPNHARLSLPPHRYQLAAHCKVPGSTVVPDQKLVDVRKEHEVTVNVSLPSSPHPPPPPPPTPAGPQVSVGDTGPAPIAFTLRRASDLKTLPSGQRGRVIAATLEPAVTIELTHLEPPYERREAYGRLDAFVPTGSYGICFRLGREVFSATEIVVGANDEVKVEPQVAATPLVTEALDLGPDYHAATVVSETIGSIQAGVLDTMLPILGIKPFAGRGLFHMFNDLLPDIDWKTDESWSSALSLVVACDGDGWPESAEHAIEAAEAKIRIADGVQPLELRRLSRSRLRGRGETLQGGAGLGRVAVGLLPLEPDRTRAQGRFEVHVETPDFGGIRLPTAFLAERVTVISVVLSPDGSFSLRQNLLRFPGRDYPGELAPRVSFGRMLRDLQLGQKLYEAGTLTTFARHDYGLLNELLYAKWTDPALSCMAYLALREASRAAGSAVDEQLLSTTAANLSRYFHELPDARIISALQSDSPLATAVGSHEVPLLAESARLLAHARADGGTRVHEFAERMPVDQPWTVNIDAPRARK